MTLFLFISPPHVKCVLTDDPLDLIKIARSLTNFPLDWIKPQEAWERERALASVFYTRLLRLSFYSWVIYRLLSNVACFRRRCERAPKHVNAQRPPAFWDVGLPSQQGAPAKASHDKSVPHKRCKVSPI